MAMKYWITAALTVSFGAAALAHSGATGVVKERMDGMSAMSKAVKAMAPIMRGKEDYDADAVRAAADVFIAHAGEDMVKLFPEGSDAMPSVALPAIWEEPEEFAALAEKLQVYATGLKEGAENGLAKKDGGGQSSSMMGGSSGGMMNTGSASSMMGGGASSMMGGGASSMMGGAAAGEDKMMTVEEVAALPTDAAFAAVTQTCSACHQKFRAEKN